MSVKTLSIQEIRSNLSEIVERTALTDEQFIITRFGKPKARISGLKHQMKEDSQPNQRKQKAIEALSGIWEDRDDIKDSAQWVATQRKKASQKRYSSHQ